MQREQCLRLGIYLTLFRFLPSGSAELCPATTLNYLIPSKIKLSNFSFLREMECLPAPARRYQLPQPPPQEEELPPAYLERAPG
jgi:hypothetical protein